MAGKKLLIVEDEPVTRSLLSQIFAEMGHHVQSAEDGFDALRKIRHEVPDVLLSDLNMPGMSGFELLSVVRRRLPGIYVIATSGAYTGKTVPEGIAADSFYEKASGISGLLALLDHPNRAEPDKRRGPSATPIWSAQAEVRGPGEKFVRLTCTDCLRAFEQKFTVAEREIEKTHCVYCQTRLHYAVVQTLDPTTSQPFVG